MFIKISLTLTMLAKEAFVTVVFEEGKEMKISNCVALK